MKKTHSVYPESEKQALQHDYKKIQALIVTDEFQRLVSVLRKECNLPVTGISFHSDLLGKKYEKWMDKFGKNYRRKFMSVIERICVKSHLSYDSWESIIREYIITGNLISLESINKERGFLAWGTCYVEDLEEYQNSDIPIVDENETHPIALRISPDATQRDIVDYVRKSFSEIVELQNKYKVNKLHVIYRKKTSIIQKRNGYIYEHRELQLKEIADKLSLEMNIQLSETEIAKILSLEKKRRAKAIDSI